MAKRRLTRIEQREVTRSRVMDTAEKVFSAKGFRGASLDEIAEKAGYSKGAVYSNFDSKADLFLAVMDRRADREAEAMVTAGSAAAATASGALTEPTGWALATLDFFLEAVRTPHLRSTLAARYGEERGKLGAILPMGGDAWASPEEMATIAMALGSGLVIQTALDKTAVPPDLYGRSMDRLLGTDAGDVKSSG